MELTNTELDNAYKFLENQLKIVNDDTILEVLIQIDEEDIYTARILLSDGNKKTILDSFKESLKEEASFLSEKAESLDLIITIKNWINRKTIVNRNGYTYGIGELEKKE